MKDYYLILGVPKNCSQEDIKKAYRKLARKYHPDTSQKNDATQFCDVQEAYENIGTAEKRKAYDEKVRRHEAEKQNEIKISRQKREFFGKKSSPKPSNFQNFISNTHGIFDNSVLEIILTPEEALSGTIVPLKIPIEMECPDCSGFGSLGFFFPICPTCRGTGVIVWQHLINIKIPPRIAPNSKILINVADEVQIQAIVTIQ